MQSVNSTFVGKFIDIIGEFIDRIKVIKNYLGRIVTQISEFHYSIIHGGIIQYWHGNQLMNGSLQYYKMSKNAFISQHFVSRF